MKRGAAELMGRVAALGAVLALAFALVGDRGSASTVPATIYGQDPLEILELKVRPNVIVILDSSGSMTSNVTNTTNLDRGDHPRSKLYQAKSVLRDVVKAYQDRVNFQFGTYSQKGVYFQDQPPKISVVGSLYSRWAYVASGTTTAAPLRSPTIWSWQFIHPEWNTLYFAEEGTVAGTVGVTCQATIPGTPRYYRSGATLAADLQAAMNSATCTGALQNTYAVTHNSGSGYFTFSIATGTTPFQLRWSVTPNNIGGALGAVTYDSFDPSIRKSGNSALSINNKTYFAYQLLTQGANATYNETIDGTLTYFYEAQAWRLWNGQVMRVSVDDPATPTNEGGRLCDVSFPTAAEKTNPPSFKLQGVSAVLATNPDGTTRIDCLTDIPGNTLTFSFAGGTFSGNSVSCMGFRSKSDLIPCDLQSPPAPLQFDLISPYINLEMPFDDAGNPADYTTKGATLGDPGYGVPDGLPDYEEWMDGTWATKYATTPKGKVSVAPSAKGIGNTPLANTLIDIKGLPDASAQCLVDPRPPAGTYDPTEVGGTVGACETRGFAKLWDEGQAGSEDMAGPWPWKLDPIKNHRDPKEKTIVLLVTDGNDTCGLRGEAGASSAETDNLSLRAAYHAERLYTALDPNEPASSVQTYVIGFGGAVSAAGDITRLNWIAWGGSGMGQGKAGQPDVATIGTGCESAPSSTTLTGAGAEGDCRWSMAPSADTRAACTTCQDAFIAPNASVLKDTIQAIIDQGAQEGEFIAGRSVTESVFEYADRAGSGYASNDPTTRYKGIVPTRFVSSFSLPGFKGQLRAYQANAAGTVAIEKWAAGEKLINLVNFGVSNAAACPASGSGMCGCDTTSKGGGVGQCTFDNLTGTTLFGTTIANESSALDGARIKRRIYTTLGNGVYYGSPFSGLAQGLITRAATRRVRLWPPQTGLLPTDYTSTAPSSATTPLSAGWLDAALGLPPDTPTCASVPAGKTCPQVWYEQLQKQYLACKGTNLPAACVPAATPDYAALMKATRREARDIAIAYLAGAEPIPSGDGWKRTNEANANQRKLLYKARGWILADSEATAAVMPPPVQAEPGVGTQQYRKYRDGVAETNDRSSQASHLAQSFAGLGLKNPDAYMDSAEAKINPALKPAMTVVYVPANDMLHAFRAGPCYTPSTATTTGQCLQADASLAPSTEAEHGGEEVWGFLPFDQLNSMSLRFVYRNQTRANHVYTMAGAVRFADVFVPGSVTWSSGSGVTKLSYADTTGVWRRVMYVGRGIGGKYVTALDVTGTGPYSLRGRDAGPPMPLWSRGNPDTVDGSRTGTRNNTGTDGLDDYNAYLQMGQTWSVPAVAYVADQNPALYQTVRRPTGLQFALFMGSGFGDTSGCATAATTDPCEGRTFFVLDALSGDVVASADVGSRAGMSFENAIVSSPAGFNPKTYQPLNPVHPALQPLSRLYVGDIHGRVWKFLTAAPQTAIPFADLGAGQPVGTPPALIGIGSDPDHPDDNVVPYVYVTSGNENRVDGPFKIYGFRDDGGNSETATSGVETGSDGQTLAFQPARSLFVQEFAQGSPDANCGDLPEEYFRGTVQPTTVFECLSVSGSTCNERLGRVFFGGTRLSLPNTKFAPPTPLACATGEYPCRSQFDSIVYAVGAKTGEAAYTMGGDSSGYKLYRDSRIQSLQMQADPLAGRGGSRLAIDEGRLTGAPQPPPPPGTVGGVLGTTPSVIMKQEEGQPPPAVRYGSTVCQ